jgi:hypothetical protein
LGVSENKMNTLKLSKTELEESKKLSPLEKIML